jgi:anti-sigma B factor antagonist
MLLNIVERRVEPDITVLELTGRLALGRESQRIETLVEELVKKRAGKVVLDLTGVEYIDSTGIGIIALASGKLRGAGGTMALVASEGRVLQMIKLTQIDAILTVHPTVAAAAAAV